MITDFENQNSLGISSEQRQTPEGVTTSEIPKTNQGEA